MTRPLRIAMVGSRGVPASYGGVERHVEAVGSRLAARGHRVTVYCLDSFLEAALAANPTVDGPALEYQGMTLVSVPGTSRKQLEAIVHSARSTVRAMRAGHDIVHYHAVGPGLLAPLPRLVGKARVVQTVHGLDAQRAKWGRVARTALTTATWLSAKVPHATVVVSRTLREHYRTTYGRECWYVPNGMEAIGHRPPNLITSDLGLPRGGYVLFVGRLEPGKHADMLLRAYRDVDTDLPLVIAGGSGHTDSYAASLQQLADADDRARLIGYVQGELLDELYANAAVLAQPSGHEGLPLALLEAIGAHLPVVASDIAPHVEVLGASQPGGRLFPNGDQAALARTLNDALTDIDAERAGVEKLHAQTVAHYDWDAVTDQLEAIYATIVD